MAQRQSYHGATLRALSVGGNVPRREIPGPSLFDVQLSSPCYAYRGRVAEEKRGDVYLSLKTNGTQQRYLNDVTKAFAETYERLHVPIRQHRSAGGLPQKRIASAR